MEPYQTPPGSSTKGLSDESNSGSTPQNFSDAADQAKKEAKARATRAYDDAKQGARQAVKDTAGYAKNVVSDQKSTLVTKLDEYKSAALAASEKLDSENDEIAAAKVRKVANGLENVSGYLRDTDPSELFDEAGRLARKHPEIAFGTLFIAGLGLARFLKASAEARRSEPGSQLAPARLGIAEGHHPYAPTPSSHIS